MIFKSPERQFYAFAAPQVQSSLHGEYQRPPGVQDGDKEKNFMICFLGISLANMVKLQYLLIT